MRFAYIDSNGNEVPIPSVDALALRIELGAINENTELYDAQADQWGPAHSHEIFHTLARAAEGGEQGFVAPLPPVPITDTSAETTAKETAEATAVEAPPVEEVDPVSQLTLADPAPAEEGDAEVDRSGGTAGGKGASRSGRAADLSDDPLADAFLTDALGDDPAPSFDFGEVDVIESSFANGAPDDAAPMDFGVNGGFGADLEQPMEFSPDRAEGFDVGSQGLELEQPMSDFTPEAPPAWMEPQDLDEPSEDVMDFSSVGEGAVQEPVATEALGLPLRDRPSAPRFKRQRSLVGPIVSTVVLAALAVGAYVAWPIVSARFAQERTPTASQPAPPPPIPDELASRLRSAADVAFASTLSQARESVQGTSARPPENWLAGIYLANASDYGAVEAFWLSVGEELDAVRGVDEAAFMAAFEQALPASVSTESREALIARAQSGFRAGSRARARTYGQVDSVVDAALGLHDFLVANQENIEYTPASAGTADPVLEARPASDEIADALQDHLGRVTDALDELDYLDRVTADGLWAAVLKRIQEVGIS